MEVEQKLGKSLDDLIKQQRTAKAARPAKKAAGKGGATKPGQSQSKGPAKPQGTPRGTPAKGAPALKPTRDGGVTKGRKKPAEPARKQGQQQQQQQQKPKSRATAPAPRTALLADPNRKVTVTIKGRGSNAPYYSESRGGSALRPSSTSRGGVRGGGTSYLGPRSGGSTAPLSSRFDSLHRTQPAVEQSRQAPAGGPPGTRRNAHGVILPF